MVRSATTGSFRARPPAPGPASPEVCLSRRRRAASPTETRLSNRFVIIAVTRPQHRKDSQVMGDVFSLDYLSATPKSVFRLSGAYEWSSLSRSPRLMSWVTSTITIFAGEDSIWAPKARRWDGTSAPQVSAALWAEDGRIPNTLSSKNDVRYIRRDGTVSPERVYCTRDTASLLRISASRA